MDKRRLLQYKLAESFRKNAGRTAVEFKGERISYEDLEARVMKVVDLIKDKQVAAGAFLGIYMEDGLDVLVSMLGAICAGTVVVPINPQFPDGRIKEMVDAVGLRSMVVSGHVSMERKTFLENELGSGIINLEEASRYQKGSGEHLEYSRYSPLDPLYVCFTSGSTGKPKAIIGVNQSIVQFINWEIAEFGLDETVRVSQLTAYSNDAYLRDILVPLFAGGTLCLPESRECILDQKALCQWIEETRISAVHCTPSLFKLINHDQIDQRNYEGLKVVFLAGEAIKPYTLKPWYETFGQRIQLVNLYGATETTLIKMFHRIQPADVKGISIPIGKPMKGAKIIIVDENMSICNEGEIGEIYVKTPFGTKGYLNDEKLQNEKFVVNPFTGDEKDIIYRTGDLGKLLSDGNVEFLGRKDSQVKIRGNRVELSAVETLIGEIEAVDQVVVCVHEEEDEKHICAYIVGTSDIEISKVRSRLGEQLPSYMVPSYFITMDSIPLNMNGKVDLKNLPKPNGEIITGKAYVAPENEIEIKLVAAFKTVLGRDAEISTMDSFFELGGHSLKATALVAEIHKELDVLMPLSQIFKLETISAIAEYIGEAESTVFDSIEPVEKRDFYPMSSAQKRMYIVNQLDTESTSYNMPLILRIDGPLSRIAVQLAFKQLIKRHESLRTTFGLVDDELVQRVIEEGAFEFELEYAEFSHIKDSAEESNDELELAKELEVASMINGFIRPFDLQNGPLFRVGLIREADERHILMVDMHHIISDGGSAEILKSEFVKLINGEKLSPLNIQYKDYACWQNLNYESEDMKNQGRYWLERFEGEIPVLNFPTDRPRPMVSTSTGAEIHFTVEKELTARLKGIAQKCNGTLYMVLLAAINSLLHKYTGQEDIVVGAPIAGRAHKDLGKVMGMFVNTLPMRNYPVGSKSFMELLEEVKVNGLDAYENQGVQFEELIEQLDIPRDMGRNPLFDVMFTFQNLEFSEEQLSGLKISAYEQKKEISKFDMTFTAMEVQGEIRFALKYKTDLFDASTMLRVAEYFANIIDDVTSNPNKKLSEINMISENEKEKITEGFNNTKAEYSDGLTLHELFEAQAAMTPSNIALEFNGETITYAALNNQANRLARKLVQRGISTGAIVGLYMVHSIEMVTGILAVLKSGAAYLPLDTEYPLERINHMVADAQVQWVIADQERIGLEGANNSVGLKDSVISKDDVDLKDSSSSEELEVQWINIKETDLQIGRCDNLLTRSQVKDLAYVIYTSGTQGKPKGVAIEHRNIVNYVQWLSNEIMLESRDSTALVSSYAFDLGYTALFPILLSGGKLHLIPKETYRDSDRIVQYIAESGISYLKMTPSLLKIILQSRMLSQLSHSQLRMLILGGERLVYSDVEDFLKIKPDCEIMNHYGPTESTVGCIAGRLDKERLEGYGFKSIIGRPIANTKIFICDEGLNPTGIGIPGELCISGDGVGRGYLNRLELTAEKFVDRPLDSESRMYRTGDLARWLPSGEIEFLGRRDDQVKIQGYRIELEEIQNEILKVEGIKEATVSVKKDQVGDQYLCAYYVQEKKSAEITSEEIKNGIAAHLPKYMMPSYYVAVEEIPLNANGKIDHKALAAIEGEMVTGNAYVAPRTNQEKILVEIYKSVLGVDVEIGISDSFFELGGQSLKATALISRIHKAFNVVVPLLEVFQNPTVEGLAEVIQSLEVTIYDSIKNVEQRAYYPMSSAQKRMYIVNQLDPTGTSYNMPTIMSIEGELSISQVKKAFISLIERHEPFRTTFEVMDENLVQRVRGIEDIEFDVSHYDCSDLEITDTEKSDVVESRIKEFVAPFNLHEDLLLRVAVITKTSGEHVLMVDRHHIISDWISTKILADEFISIINGGTLKPLRIQYKDYAVWQEEMLQSGAFKEQEKYWLEMFQGENPVLTMPMDYPRENKKTNDGQVVEFELDKEIIEGIEGMVREKGATVYMVMLTAYYILLHKHSYQEDIVVGTPSAGRPHSDLTKVVGMFVNTLAMRNAPKEDKTFNQLLDEVKTNTLNVFDNQEIQFEELVEKLSIERVSNRNPLFDVMFSLINRREKKEIPSSLIMKPYGHERVVMKFDMEMTVYHGRDFINFAIKYSKDLFENETIKRLGEDYLRIVETIVENPEIEIQKIVLLKTEEQGYLDTNSESLDMFTETSFAF